MYLVFDVGATFIKYAIMSIDGEIEKKGKTPAPWKEHQGLEDFVETIVTIYQEVCDDYEIEGIAMGLPGQVDVDNGIVYGGGGLKYLDKVHLGELVSKSCDDVKVSLENDGKCAALAEVWKGNASDCQNACVLVFGTGIGGGIIIDRKVHRGNRLLAGELSFVIDTMTIKDMDKISLAETKATVYESFDDLDFMASATCGTSALVYKASKIKGMALEEVSGEMIYQWAREGDQDMIDLLEETYFSIAKMCCNLYLTVDPDVILIGGGISAEPAYVEGIKRYVEQLKGLTHVLSGIKIDICKYRNDSNLLGSLYNFKQKYDLL